MRFMNPHHLAVVAALVGMGGASEAPARHTVGAYVPHYAAGAGGTWQNITGAYIPQYAAGWDTITGADDPASAAASTLAAAATASAQQLGPNHPRTQMLAMHASRAVQSLGAMHAGVAGPAQAPANIAYGASLGIESRSGSKPRLFPLGFASTGTVAASASAIVTSRPQILFRGERLIVPSSVATNFQINDLRIGKNSQLVQSNALPASAFIETVVDGRMTLDTAQVGSDVSLNVTNTDGAAAHAFSAVLFGAAIDV